MNSKWSFWKLSFFVFPNDDGKTRCCIARYPIQIRQEKSRLWWGAKEYVFCPWIAEDFRKVIKELIKSSSPCVPTYPAHRRSRAVPLPLYQFPTLPLPLLPAFINIMENEYVGGANGKTPVPAYPCDCKFDPGMMRKIWSRSPPSLSQGLMNSLPSPLHYQFSTWSSKLCMRWRLY